MKLVSKRSCAILVVFLLSAQFVTAAYAAQKMNSQERSFLVKMSENIKNDTITSNLHGIIETLDNSVTLEPAQYNFLLNLAKHINNEKISGVIEKIAEEHKP